MLSVFLCNAFILGYNYFMFRDSLSVKASLSTLETGFKVNI